MYFPEGLENTHFNHKVPVNLTGEYWQLKLFSKDMEGPLEWLNWNVDPAIWPQLDVLSTFMVTTQEQLRPTITLEDYI